MSLHGFCCGCSHGGLEGQLRGLRRLWQRRLSAGWFLLYLPTYLMVSDFLCNPARNAEFSNGVDMLNLLRESCINFEGIAEIFDISSQISAVN